MRAGDVDIQRSPRRPHVVILGAGFGGLTAARRFKHAAAEITVIDRRNYHLFQPLLYQVATAGLSPGDIAYPVRAVLRKHRNTRVLLAEATAVDVKTRHVRLEDGAVPYDYLIVSTGAGHSYFGHPEWETYAPGLKSVEDAVEIRGRILLGFERAEREPDVARRRALLTFVIVGGGPTGVELAGAIAEIARMVMVQDFRAIDPRDARIILVEAGPRLLSSMPERLSMKAEQELRRRGVEVLTNSLVTHVNEGSVKIADRVVAAGSILWAAGVSPSPLGRSLEVPLNHEGRVPVLPDLSVPGHPEIFVIGDLAACLDDGGRVLPGLAAVAVQQGRHAANNILRLMRGSTSEPFQYADRGTMATIGRAAAVADFGRIQLWGLSAWLLWIFVHIALLIGFRNRMVVLFDWAWAYVALQRSARLITGCRHPARRPD
jgi:NADH:ubiquinone reductase (H+-translocating)